MYPSGMRTPLETAARLTCTVPASERQRVPSILPLFSDRQPAAKTSGNRISTLRMGGRRMVVLRVGQPAGKGGFLPGVVWTDVVCIRLTEYRMRTAEGQIRGQVRRAVEGAAEAGATNPDRKSPGNNGLMDCIARAHTHRNQPQSGGLLSAGVAGRLQCGEAVSGQAGFRFLKIARDTARRLHAFCLQRRSARLLIF